ncbi:Importin-11 [Smittium culicis]|uniref:Importin-11 n=1 Tax=Smittium culicis TaxID=133412 RepID=A0A1R1WXL5_9FUNG|nr:Importin-11 [Smittium culicis]
MIRSRLIEQDCSDTNQINLQYNLAISKIARWDFPVYWPSILEDLVNNVEFMQKNCSLDTNFFRIENSLIALHYSIKTSCGRVLATERNAFKAFSASFIPKISNWYKSYIYLFFENQSYNPRFLVPAIYCMKIIKRLFAFGISNPENNPDCLLLYDLIFESLSQFYNFFSNSSTPNDIDNITKLSLKLIVSIGKFYIEVSKFSPTSFVLMEKTVSVMQWYGNILVSNEADTPPFFQYNPLLEGYDLTPNKIHLQSMLLFKAIVRNLAFETDYESQNENSPATICNNIIAKVFFNDDFVSLLINAMITKYMVLSNKDIDKWEFEPEEWIIEEESDNWLIDIRACSEKLFTELFMDKKEILLPQLLSNLGNTSELSIQKKDALYTAVGLCAFELSKSINFTEWLQSHLINDIKQSYAGSEIIRRRIVWLIGKWVTNGLVPDNLALCYEIILQCLSENETSIVVKLSSVVSLNECFNDWNFDPNDLAQYSEIIVKQLVSLLKNPLISESKPIVINCLSMFIERMRSSIKPVLGLLIEAVPIIWEDIASDTNANGEINNPNSIKSVIDLTTNLVNSSGVESQHLNNFVCPMITFSCCNSPVQVFLQERGLELWMASLKQCEFLSSDLASLFGLVCQLIGSDNSEFMSEYFSILQSYFYLHLPFFVFEQNKENLLNIKNSNEISSVDVINRITVGFQELVLNITGHLVSNSYNSKFFCSMINMLDALFLSINTADRVDFMKFFELLKISNFIANIYGICQSGSKYSPIVMSYAAALLARLILISGDNIGDFVRVLASIIGQSDFDIVLKDLCHILLNNYDMLVYQKHRKLVCLALSILVSTTSISVLNHLSSIISVVWIDFQASSGNSRDYANTSDDPKKRMLLNKPIGISWDKGVDKLNSELDVYDDDCEESSTSQETIRKHYFANNDFVAKVNELLFIKARFSANRLKYSDEELVKLTFGDLSEELAMENLNFIKSLPDV